VKARAKRGRPEKAPGGLTSVLYVRLTAGEHRRIRQSARELGRLLGVNVSVGDYVRRCLGGAS